VSSHLDTCPCRPVMLGKCADVIRSGTETVVGSCKGSAQTSYFIVFDHGRIDCQFGSCDGSDYPECPENRTGRYADGSHCTQTDDRLWTRQVGCSSTWSLCDITAEQPQDESVADILRILVLDHGKVLEFGTPWELLQKEDGSFRDLCKQSGEEAQLFEVSIVLCSELWLILFSAGEECA
jgi:hypothetical protein